MNQFIKCLFGFHDWGFNWQIPEKKNQGYADHCGLVRCSLEECQNCFKIRWGLKYPEKSHEQLLKEMKEIEALFQ